jgi:hypothetical protein
MANNYLQFSSSISDLNKEEAEWWNARLGGDHDEEEDDPYADPVRDYQAEVEGENGVWSVWFYAEEFGEPAHVAHDVQEFFAKFRPEGVFTLEWAVTCSKMRVGEFGGGFVVITAQGCSWSSQVQEYIESYFEKHKRLPPPPSMDA